MGTRVGKKIPVLHWEEIKPEERDLGNPKWFNLVVNSFRNPHAFMREGDRIFIPVWYR